MRRAAPCSIVILVAACSSARYGASETGAPSVTFPARFAEGAGDADGGSAPLSDAATAPAARAPSSFAPDPVPLTEAIQWEYALDYSKGVLRVRSVRRVELRQAVPTARRMGRFAFEIWIGKELVDRVRFDFPLLAADAPPEGVRRPLHEQARFGPKAETQARILVPASDRATRALIVDRQTGAVTEVPWPPSAAAPEAGS